MSYTTQLPSYTELAEALQKMQSEFEPAQVHGLLCGFICGTSGELSAKWEKLITGSKKNQKTHVLLQELYETSYHQLSEFSFEFSLLLPDDETDINARTESLGLWCQGFLAGLQQANVKIENREPSEMTEALDDIIEIAQVSYGNISENDDDESAYFELLEYVRLAVLMIYHELKGDNLPADTDQEDLSH